MSTLDPPAAYAATQEALIRCRGYRLENGLYGVVEPALGRIMLDVGVVGAISMPATLGCGVRELLRDGSRCGPVIGHPRSARWTFLTGPAGGSTQDPALLAEMFHLGANLAVPGARVVLPSPADERTGYRLWIDPPEGTFRPDVLAVLAAMRRYRAARGLSGSAPGSA
ncbi:hypothetical protein [Nocardia sp. alder85J]|uniref:hypothetical protein n=1 Tax=Nocardia sp. alder85J TaxID=2862949 RepID=UPI001CD3AD21|nr:hypothetical protein [Nocardia sp. alder85J]MCX4096499.1 hypothetical protein [Nocardia sp. alder85J]